MSTPAPTHAAHSNRRTIALLAVAQALFQSVQSMAISTTPLAGYSLLGADKSLATLPIFLSHAGIMLTTIPASLLMARIGRRAGFSIGALIGIASGLVGFAAIWIASFQLLCVAALLQGSAAAFAWYFRFAATDAAAPADRAKAISLVMAGGVLAGVLGPQTAKWSVAWFEPVLFAGVYLMIAAFAAAGLFAIQFLRVPPLSIADRREPGRPLAEIARQPAFRVALLTSMFGYAVMTLVMTVTPIAMLACGFGFADSATVIQAHVVAMFLPSFFTGHLIARVGVLPVIVAGAAIEAVCALINLGGVEFGNFLFANVCVGLGWNFCYVGGSTLLTETYRATERARVQAAHDFAVYATTATAAALSGFLLANAGWTVVNIAALPLLALVTFAALRLAFARQRAAALA